MLLGVVLGKRLDDSAVGHCLLFSKPTLSIILPVYAAIASILPVWVLLCPRGYLSSYMKIGVIVVLAVGIVAACPVLKMPATTPFISGGGPVVPGSVWPFVCIVIMCGAMSGFHALVSSGTTPKMIDRSRTSASSATAACWSRASSSIMALIAACSLEPGDYFKINVAVEKHARMVEIGTDQVCHSDLRPKEFDRLAGEHRQGETGRQDRRGRDAGGGHGQDLHQPPRHAPLTTYWYHFIIMFEALFILTLLETGTRACRFIFEEAVQQFWPRRAAGRGPNWLLNVAASSLVCFLWGYLLYTGNIEDLWRMMGVANQLLAIIALALGTSYLLAHSSRRIYALTTAVPLVFVTVTVFTAGVQSIESWLVELANPALDAASVFHLKLISVLTGIMLILSALVLVQAVRSWYGLLTKAARPEAELAAVPALPGAAGDEETGSPLDPDVVGP